MRLRSITGFQAALGGAVLLFMLGSWFALGGHAADPVDEPAAEADSETEQGAAKEKPEKEAPPQLPNDKKLLALHNDFIKKAEKLAGEYEHSKQPDKAVIVYQQILRLTPNYAKARQSLDRLRAQEANASRKVFEVQANRDWQDTGVRLIQGKPVKLTASGSWTFNMSHKLGPDGMEMPKVLKDFRWGSLIGIIADPSAKTPKPFYIGNGKDFVAEQSGPLLVRMHDSDPSDNRGSLTLEIVGRFDGK